MVLQEETVLSGTAERLIKKSFDSVSGMCAVL